MNKSKILFSLLEKYSGDTPRNINYQDLCKDLMLLSDARYVVLNLFNDYGNTYKAFAVPEVESNQAADYVLENKARIYEISKVEQLPIDELAAFIPELYVSKIISNKKPSFFYVCPLLLKDRLFGFFVLLPDAESSLAYPEEVKIFVNHLTMHFHQQDLQAWISKRTMMDAVKQELGVIVNEHYKIDFINNLLSEFTASEVIGADALLFINPEYREPYKKCIERALSGEVCSMEMYVEAANGYKDWYLCEFFPLTQYAGKVYINAKNISNEKKLSKELNDIRNVLYQAEVITKMAVWEFDTVKRKAILSASGRLVFKDDNLEAIMFDKMLNNVDPGYREGLSQLIDLSILNKKAIDVTFPVTTSTGEKIWLRNIGEFISDDRMKITSIDVTEQQNLFLKLELTKVQLQNKIKAIELSSKIRQSYILNSDNSDKYINRILPDLLAYTDSKRAFYAEAVYGDGILLHFKINEIITAGQANEIIKKREPLLIEANNYALLFDELPEHQQISVRNNAVADKKMWQLSLPHHQPFKSFMQIPVFSAPEFLRGIIVIADKNTDYDREDLDLLTPIISVISNILQTIEANIEKIRIEEFLKSEKHRLEGVLEATSAGTFDWNIKTNKYAVNERWAEMMGYTLSELEPFTFEKWADMLHPDDREAALNKHMLIRQGKSVNISGILRIKHKYSGWIWVHYVGKTLKFDEDGTPQIMYGVNTDITQERESKQFLLDILDDLYETQRLAKVGRWDLDITNDMLLWSQEVYTIFEKDSSSVKPTYEAFLELVHPDDVNMVNEAYTNSLKTKLPYQITHRLLMPDGRIKWLIEKCNTTFDNKGNPLKSVGLVQDITELKEAENKIKKQAENYKFINSITNELIKISTENSDVEMQKILNQIAQYYDIEGASLTAYDMHNKTILADYYIDKSGYLPSSNVFKTPLFDKLIDFLRNDGYLIWNKPTGEDNETPQLLNEIGLKSSLSAPLFDEKGDITGTLGLMSINKYREWTKDEIEVLKLLANNISDARIKLELEKNLANAKEKAELASKYKSEFLASISHEIRTPMNAILGYSQLLEERIQDPKLIPYIKGVIKGGDNLLSLINDILDFSKIEAGAVKIENKPVSIKKIIDDLQSIFGATAKLKGIKGVIEIEKGLPDSFYLDEMRINQILLNLVSNAFKFTDKGSVVVTVSGTKNSNDTYDLIFTVKDTGIGIPANEHEKIFEAFVQKDGQDSKKYSGTGLGLAITKNLANLMGGTISLFSEPGKGSEFRVMLPHVKIVSTKLSKLNTPVKQELVTVHFNHQNILLVEDNASNRGVILAYCEQYNLNITEAENAQQALAHLKKNVPDLILMDIMMPGMDGFELTQKIRENKRLKSVKIVALTAKLMSDEDNEKLKLFDEFIFKPISKNNLLRVMNRLLNENEGKWLETHIIIHKKLADELLDKHEKITRLMSIDDITAFAELLRKKAKEHKNADLMRLAEVLYGYCKDFEMDKINDWMHKFPSLLRTTNSAKISK